MHEGEKNKIHSPWTIIQTNLNDDAYILPENISSLNRFQTRTYRYVSVKLHWEPELKQLDKH